MRQRECGRRQERGEKQTRERERERGRKKRESERESNNCKLSGEIQRREV